MEAAESSGADNSRSSPLRSRKVRLGLLIAALAALLLGLWWYLDYESHGRYQQSTNDAYIQADSVVVAPKIGGYIDRVLIAENQSVRAGQPLALLDPRDYRAQASQVQAQIEASRATADTVRAQVGEQQAAVAQAEAQRNAAQAEVTFARQQLDRYEPLAASGAEPRERVTQLRNQLQQALAKAESSRAAVLAAQRRFGTLDSQIEQALSQARASQAQLEAANVILESTTLRASIDGRVGDLTVRVGQFVQPGTRLMTIVPVNQIYVEANFKETQVGLMRVGQPVSIEVDALPGVELRGKVASFAPGTGAQFSILPPQNATGNFTKIVQRIPVRIAIEASPAVRRLLSPGMSVEVSVDTRSARGELERIRESQETKR
ncbi:MAG: HlyD family secretion protein [Qipengyuania sp.]|nr:HlyD family secretion protein [Qipengyuania sp.]